jgi:hypothetical protein
MPAAVAAAAAPGTTVHPGGSSTDGLLSCAVTRMLQTVADSPTWELETVARVLARVVLQVPSLGGHLQSIKPRPGLSEHLVSWCCGR